MIELFVSQVVRNKRSTVSNIMLDQQVQQDLDLISIENLWRISVPQYHAMIASGALTEDDRIELLQGWLVEKMPKNPRHSTITRVIRKYLEQLVPEGVYVDSQEPITTDDSEPELDVFVVKGSELDFVESHPKPKDVSIVIEVSDSTLKQDQTLKKRLYARAGIPVYWIANIPDNQIEVYSEPYEGTSGADYRQRQTYGIEDKMPIVMNAENLGTISVAQLLPK